MPFDLVEEPWLEVRLLDEGPLLSMGLREVILRAHEISDLTVELPTIKPVLFRQMLLPVVMDALGGLTSSDWINLMRVGRFEGYWGDRISRYLDEHRGLFDLFHSVNPFAQVAGMHTAKDQTKSPSLLVATMSSGNNVPIFDYRTEADPLELTPAQAIRWLLHTQCWDTAGLKTGVVGDSQASAGKTSGNPVGPLGRLGVVMPMGRTLFDSLLLNLPTNYTPHPDDRPQWLRRSCDGPVGRTLSIATPQWQVRAPKGLLDLWTWQSRRILLFPEETASGTRVTQVLVAAGDRLDSIPSFEPHTAWRIDSKKSSDPTERPRRHQSGRAAWRGMDALLASDLRENASDQATDSFRPSHLMLQFRAVRDQLPADYPLRVELVGVTYGNQAAVIEDLLFDTFPLPLTALTHDGLLYTTLLKVADQVEKLEQALDYLSADLQQAVGTEPIPWGKGRPGEIFLHALGPVIRQLTNDLRPLSDNFEAVEELLPLWERQAGELALQVADSLLSNAPPRSFTGRVVEEGGQQRIYRASTAEASFRRRVNQTLTRRTEARRVMPAKTGEAWAE